MNTFSRLLSIITIALMGMSIFAMHQDEQYIDYVTNKNGDQIILLAMRKPFREAVYLESATAVKYDSFVFPSMPPYSEKPTSQRIAIDRDKDEVVVIVGNNAPQYIELKGLSLGLKNVLIIDENGKASVQPLL